MEFRPLHTEFGAEVTGFDLMGGGSPTELDELRAAFDRFAMLLFRGQGWIDPARHVEIAGWFGPPSPVSNVPGDNCVSVLANEDAAGSMRLPFHSDMTYTDDPVAVIALHAIALPDAPTSTSFVSGQAAWERLPAGLKRRLEGLTLRHFLHSDFPEYDWPDFSAVHPVVKPHPRTGRPILFVTEHHAEHIVELPEVESRALLDELLGYLYEPAYRYEHVWQGADMLVWDNLALQHARTEHSDPGNGRRALQRVALCDTPLPVLVERARAAMAG